MGDRDGHMIGIGALFIALTLIASTMLILAILLLLSDLIGSLIAALLILGFISGLIALILYISTLKPYINTLRAEFRTIYEVATFARNGSKWVMDWGTKFIQGLYSDLFNKRPQH